VANYTVDIAVALKGAQKLDAFNKKIKQTEEISKVVNINMKLLGKNNDLVIRSFNSLSKAVGDTKKNFNEAAIGTSNQKKAAKELVAAQKELNKELSLGNKLLTGVRSAQGRGLAVDPVLKSIERNARKNRPIQQTSGGFLKFSQSADKILAEKIVSTKRQELELQEALLALEIKSAAKQNEKLQIQGELNRQTAQAVNDLKLRGQFSPLTSDVRGNIFDVKSRIEENILASRRAKFRNVFSGVSGRDFGQIGGRIGPVEPIRSEGGFLAFSKAATKIQKDTKNISAFTKKSSQILSQQATRDAFEAPMIPPPQKRLTLPERLGIGRRANPRGMFASQTGVSGRIRGGLQSGLIGGGFPLLFGQGGLGAAAGGIGGLAGGALSPGFGFAGSIVATAAAQEIQKIIDFRKAIKELNVELQNQGINTKITRTQIKQLAKDLKITKEEAIQVTKEFGKFQDVGGLNLARIFGDRATFDATVGLDDFSSTLNRIQTLSEKLTLGQEFEAYKILSTEGSEAANEFIKNSLLASEQSERFQTRFENDLKKFETVGVSSVRKVFGALNDLQIQTFFNEDFEKVIRQVIKDDEEIQKILNDPKNTTFSRTGERLISVSAKQQIDVRLKEILGDTLLLQQALNKLPAEFDLSTVKAKELVDALSANVENLMFLEEFKAPEEELKKLEKAQRIIIDVSKEMKLGFEDAFKGIVKGTMTVSDAFRSMLNRISDYFLDLAAQIFALGLQKSFLGLFQNLFNIQMPSISGMADGGRVTGGRPYIVGERGPELFTPGVGGSITPNEALGGGLTNIVVNVDASGSNVEGDEDEGRALGIALSAAIETELIKQKRPGGLLA